MKELRFILPNYPKLRRSFILFIKWYSLQTVKIDYSIIKELHCIFQKKDDISIDDFFRMKILNSSISWTQEVWALYLYESSIFIDRYLMKIIIDYLPKETVFQFRKPFTTIYSDIIICIDFPLKKSGCSIINNNTWDEIKKNLDLKSKGISTLNNECSLCFEKTICLVSCNKCANVNCSKCYLDIIRTNRGLHKCPFCRHEFGRRFDEDKAFETFMKNLEYNVTVKLKKN